MSVLALIDDRPTTRRLGKIIAFSLQTVKGKIRLDDDGSVIPFHVAEFAGGTLRRGPRVDDPVLVILRGDELVRVGHAT